MKNQVIAKRYARALFNLADEAQAIEQYGTELGGFAEVLVEFPDLGNLLRNPLYPEAVKRPFSRRWPASFNFRRSSTAFSIFSS